MNSQRSSPSTQTPPTANVETPIEFAGFYPNTQAEQILPTPTDRSIFIATRRIAKTTSAEVKLTAAASKQIKLLLQSPASLPLRDFSRKQLRPRL